jgi:hypothetical protein
MTKAIVSQTSFTAGELDPRLAARHDYDSFYKGGETLTNVVCLGQGGVKRRPGMKYIGAISESTTRFVKFEFNITQTYLLVFVALKMYVYKDGVLQTNINGSGNDYLVTPWDATEIQDFGYTQSADTLIVCHNDYVPRKIVRSGSHSSWAISNMTFSYQPSFDFTANYDSGTFTISPSNPVVGDTVTVTCSGATPVTSGHVGGMFEGNGGIVRITGYSSSTVFTGSLVQEFINNNSISGSDASLEEPVWSASRGYPGSVTFHEARMWFSNSTSRPQTLWGSVIGDFWNFDRGSARDDESIDITLDTDQVNAIYHLVSGPHLQIFTSGGEFYIPDRPIKPSSVGVLRQTRFGILKKVQPINVDGATMFIQRNGKQVREFLYTYQENSYNSHEINLLAPHLINSPVSMAAQTGDIINEGNYLFVVNGDGTVAVFITNRAEQVTAWTRYTTTGTIKQVAVVEDVVYFFVQRTINGSTVYHIEALDNDYYTDSAIQVTNDPASATVSGLSHLNGEECRVRADNSVMDKATPSSGSITLTRTATNIEVGLNYNLEVKTMPVNIALPSGPINAKMRRILRVSAQLYETAGIKINGKVLPVKGFGVGVLGAGVTNFTGIKSIPILGYSKTTQVSVTQVDPMPMTLLGLTVEVQVTG